jgi:predicted Na+-dependent transporter
MYNSKYEKAFLNPDLKQLSFLSLLLIIIISSSTGLSFLFEGKNLWIWASISFILCLLFLGYILYGYIRLARIGLKTIKETSSLRQALKESQAVRNVSC